MRCARDIRLVGYLLIASLLFVSCGGDSDSNDTQSAKTPSTNVIQDQERVNQSNDRTSRLESTAITEDHPEGSASPSTTSSAGIPSSANADLDEDGNGFYTRDELRSAIEAIENEFVFPPGYSLEIDVIVKQITAPHPDNAEYEVGIEYTVIGNAHLCAWGNEWLQAQVRGDTLTMDVAMDQLMNVSLKIPTFTDIAPYLKEFFEQAQLGDSANLQLYINSDCNWSFFESTPTALRNRNYE